MKVELREVVRNETWRSQTYYTSTDNKSQFPWVTLGVHKHLVLNISALSVWIYICLAWIQFFLNSFRLFHAVPRPTHIYRPAETLIHRRYSVVSHTTTDNKSYVTSREGRQRFALNPKRRKMKKSRCSYFTYHHSHPGQRGKLWYFFFPASVKPLLA